MGAWQYYGHTCNKCPSRGRRDIIGDFVLVDTFTTVYNPQGSFNDVGLVEHEIALKGDSHYVPVGWPDRCKTCNANYQRQKTAREAVLRSLIVKEQTNIKFLKFTTFTHATSSGDWHLLKSRKECVDEFKTWFVNLRKKMESEFNVRGGTDVLECVDDEWIDPIFGFTFRRHHVHAHGVWICPYIDFKKWKTFKSTHNIGRDRIEAIRGGKNAIYNATDYLAKYISKENVGVKRMVWGDLRKWKESIPYMPICFKCMKTTKDYDLILAGKFEKTCDECR